MKLKEFYLSGKPLSMKDISHDKELARDIQWHLIRLDLLDPPADGVFGPLSENGLETWQLNAGIPERGLGKKTAESLIETPSILPDSIVLGNNLASAIARYYQSQNWWMARRPGEINICYLEGANADGKPNADRPNEWNDRRVVWAIAGKHPTIRGNWLASCEPGWHYTLNPMNPDGCARIKNPAQYKAWRVGTHGGSRPHESLIQVGPVEVYRDKNKDMQRPGDKLHQGLYGINQHWGYGLQHVDRASAGCMVVPNWEDHKEFMGYCKKDPRYSVNPAYLFWSAFIPANQLALN